MQKRIAKEEALFYKEILKKEITQDRLGHGKKPLKDKKADSNPPPSSGGRNQEEVPTIKSSTTDPESG